MSRRLVAVPAGGEPENPAGAARVLGTHLRQLRETAELRLVDVVQSGVIGSAPTLSRIENATTPVQEETVVRLARYYGVRDTDALDALSALVRAAHSSEWWTSFRDVIPGWMERLISVEAAAKEIRTYEVQYVPGLLQTPAYARTLLSRAFPGTTAGGKHLAERDVDRGVDVRQRRQAVLAQTSAPKYVALIDEAILARPVGGAAIMREQLRHLYNVEENREQINIRILPFASGDKAMGPAPSITYLKLAARPEEMVYLEFPSGGTYITAAADVEHYQLALTRLWGGAASRKKSLQLIEKYIQDLSERDEPGE